MTARKCDKEACKEKNGNCLDIGSDSLPVQCVGPWAEDKYYYEENLKALTTRIPPEASSYEAIKGDSNLIVRGLVDKLLKHRFKRYHFVFADPFGPDALKFETIKELARLQRVDILIHFPIMAIRRSWHFWIKKGNTILDEFLGTEKWREEIESLPSNKVFDSLINLYEYELKKAGFTFIYDLKPVTIRNRTNAPLYDLILVSKDSLAQKIWNTTINKTPDGQKTFGF